MNEQYKVSIVVPIYNGARYLPMLYDRIHNQTYSNIETLLIDDFSTDESFEMLTKFAQEDPRIKALRTKKKGGTAVRTQVQAIPFCTGDYHFYASQDDFFDYDMVEKCVAKAVETGAQIVLPDMTLYYEGKETLKHGKYPLNGDYSQTISGREAYLLSLNWQLHGFALREMKLFQQEALKPEYYNGEELAFRKMFLRANQVAFCNSFFYYRQDNPDAITKQVHYYHVDVLTTDVILYETLREAQFPAHVCRERLKVLSATWLRYCRMFARRRLGKEGRRYVNDALWQAFKKIMYEWALLMKNTQ